MQKVEKEFQHNTVEILSLKNQKAFDKANRVGIKNHSKSMILITYFEKSESTIVSDNNRHEQNSESVHALVYSYPQKTSIHLGLKISKKIGKAVTRNKIRRRIKAIMYLLPNFLEKSLINNRVIVIIPKKGMDKLPYESLESEIIRTLSK